MTLNKGMLSSKSDMWETPQKLFDELNREFNFTLDRYREGYMTAVDFIIILLGVNIVASLFNFWQLDKVVYLIQKGRGSNYKKNNKNLF